MRYKFRGKTKEGKWVYGSFEIDGDNNTFIIIHRKNEFPSFRLVKEVIPETVGQYTGLKDKNGVEIYEGDRFLLNNQGMTGYLFYETEKMEWKIRCDNEGVNNFVIDAYGVDNYKLIGNIHDKTKDNEKI